MPNHNEHARTVFFNLPANINIAQEPCVMVPSVGDQWKQ